MSNWGRFFFGHFVQSGTELQLLFGRLNKICFGLSHWGILG